MRRYLAGRVARDGFGAVRMALVSLVTGAAPWHDPARATSALRLASRELEQLEHEAHRFEARFRAAAGATAQELLRRSEREIAQALAVYGIDASRQAVTFATDLLIKDPGSLDLAVESLVRGSQSGRAGRAFAARAGRRADLAVAARELLALQGHIDALTARRARLVDQAIADETCHSGHHSRRRAASQDARWRSLRAVVSRDRTRWHASRGQAAGLLRSVPEPPSGLSGEEQLRLLNGDIRGARRRFAARWLELERRHPVLAAYRGPGGRADAGALAQVGAHCGDQEATRAMLRTVLPRLANIHKTRVYLRTGQLSPLALPPVVELTRQRLGVARGGFEDRVVSDAARDARSRGAPPWVVGALTLGLALLTAVPSGGSSLFLEGAADLAGLSYDLYAAVEAVDEFRTHAPAADTSLDRARALSHEDPSLIWLAVTLVSLPLSAATVARTFRRAAALHAGTLSHAAAADTIHDLNTLAADHDLAPLGDRVATRGHGGAVTGASEQFQQVPPTSTVDYARTLKLRSDEGQRETISPRGIRFSQNSVGGVAEIETSMRASGWVGRPIDVVRMPGGQLVTIDNTRVLAAERAGIKVEARVHEATEALPQTMVERFTTRKGGAPSTWGEALKNRLGSQSAPFRHRYPAGAFTTGSTE